jgi:PAS domain S-box-containing protein
LELASPVDPARALLLVEDNPGDARLVTEMLRRNASGEFDVTHVTTMRDAERALRATSFACVLLDLSLPDADALEGLRALRETHPALPVVVLTGADESGAYAALGEGAQDFLVKGEVDGRLVARAVRYAVERGHADEAIRLRDRQLVESHLLARMGTWRWDLATDAVALSRELVEVVGLAPRDGMTGADLLALVHPDDRDACETVLRRAREQGGRFAFEARLLAPRGPVTTRHVGEARRGPRGVTLFGTAQDVTEARQAEAALRASDRRYRTIVETSQEGIWMVDAELVTTFVNRRLAAMLGYDAEEMLGLPLRAFMEDDAWHDALPGIELARRGEPGEPEARFRRKDGTPLYVIASTSPLRADDGSFAGAVAMVNDITDRHYDDERLRLDHEVVLALNGAGTLDAALAAVLPRVAALAEAPYVEVWHRPPGERLLEPSVVHAATGEAYAPLRDATLGVRLAPGEGLAGTAWSTSEPATGTGAAPGLDAVAASCGLRGAYAMPVVAHDATYAVVVWYFATACPSPRARDLLDDLANRLDDYALRWQVEQMKDVFLTAVSHELRTPLTALIGHATTLQRHSRALDEDLRDECVSGVVRNAAKLNVLLADLLDVDRLARGVVEPRRHLLRLDDLVRSVVTGFDPEGTRTEVVLDECVARVDPPKVERIVENLLGNAAKYVPAGSRVTVRLAVEGDDMAVLAVEDRGPGVPDDLKAAVFEPFRRGDNLREHAPGTGIGLSLVVGFARLHGGHAWVEDRPGGGSSFRVALPLAGA